MKPQHKLALLLVLFLGACAQLPARTELPIESAVPFVEETEIDRMFVAVEAAHPGQSGFRLLKDGPEAFVVRQQSARRAARSIDVQTYIWHGDTTGMYLARELLAAAERGVRVRLLVDDMDARARNAGFAALDAHPNISVRMFNPFASREGTLRFMLEGLSSFRRINHRMHNKSWIADNRVAVVGGRNLGDEYFGASEDVNFVDLDFAMIGPIVRDASASFDRYWNSRAAYPMQLLDPESVNAEALEVVRKGLQERIDEEAVKRYYSTLRANEAVQNMMNGVWPMQWSAHYTFASDDPLKATLDKHDPQRSQVLAVTNPAFNAAESDIAIISPYFVPGDEGSKSLISAAQANKRVRILTNSLIANDVAAVHGGYSRHRKTLLEGGVQLWELKPLPGVSTDSSLFGSSGASLHTKAFVIDRRTLFVGSYNLDPRSTWLNCEQGVLVENEVLARELEAIFTEQTDGQRAWQVAIEDSGKLQWSDGSETFDSDPKATAGRKFQAWITRVLHLDAQL
jgi:cardiolipin synthase C